MKYEGLFTKCLPALLFLSFFLRIPISSLGGEGSMPAVRICFAIFQQFPNLAGVMGSFFPLNRASRSHSVSYREQLHGKSRGPFYAKIVLAERDPGTDFLPPVLLPSLALRPTSSVECGRGFYALIVDGGWTSFVMVVAKEGGRVISQIYKRKNDVQKHE